MKEIHTIMVPVDLLQHTNQIVDYAAYVAREFDARLDLIHVIEFASSWGDSEYPSLASFTAELDKQAMKEMEQLIERLKKDNIVCEGKILHGNVVDSIIEYVEQKGADLIIIGTHGRKGLQKYWLGSVAERVIRLAPCPTLTCNPYI